MTRLRANRRQALLKATDNQLQNVWWVKCLDGQTPGRPTVGQCPDDCAVSDMHHDASAMHIAKTGTP
jgi:hypothetical protein